MIHVIFCFLVLEKVFNNNERQGYVRSYQMPTLLRSLNPELNYSEIELRELVTEEEKDGTCTIYDLKTFENYFYFKLFLGSGLDFDAFSRISLHFLLKQVRRESNDFSHKKLIRPDDFPEV